MMSTLGDYIKSKRESLGLNQTELAKRCGLPRTTINRLESGTTKLPSPDFRRKLATGLGVSHLDILIAAGEITREEVDADGIEPRDSAKGIPEPILVELRRMPEWNDWKIKYVIQSIENMADLERSILGRAERRDHAGDQDDE